MIDDDHGTATEPPLGNRDRIERDVVVEPNVWRGAEHDVFEKFIDTAHETHHRNVEADAERDTQRR